MHVEFVATLKILHDLFILQELGSERISGTEKIVGRWSGKDSAKLKELYEANTPILEICRVLKRDRKSVLNKVDHMMIHRTVKSAT